MWVALTEYFDLDMRQRRAELDRLTKRSDDMVALLTKRAAAKDQLIDLQLKAFKYEAEGLGLFSERRSGARLQARAANAGGGELPGNWYPGMMSNLGGRMEVEGGSGMMSNLRGGGEEYSEMGAGPGGWAWGPAGLWGGRSILSRRH